MSKTDKLAETLRFLATASRTLASSFDYKRTLADVAELVVPSFAAHFVVVTLDDRQGTTVIAQAGTGDTFDAFPALSLLHAVASPAEPVLGFTHLLDVALVAREDLIGVLRVGRSLGGFSPNDQAVLEEIALRVAVAIDSARIYTREHHVADTLQRALLPNRLPQRGGSCHAAYLPGAKEAIVGGDWYDAFELPDGRVALSIGDVAGHGLRAAVVMGEVRQAFRAAALNPKSPSEVLERANMILNMRETPTMVTALFGVYDPQTSALVYATAGHPPPILATRCGLVHVLPSEGIPLGIAPQINAIDWTFTLPSGALLALYTDGMIEYDRDPLAGELALVAAVREEALHPSADPARSLQQRIFADRKNTDDVATLTFSIAESHGDRFVYDFSAIPMAVPFVRRALATYLHAIDLPGEDGFAVITAVGEAIANAVEHAYDGAAPGVAHLVAEHQEHSLSITIEDSGRWKPAQKRDERGRGLPLMRALMDRVEIRSNAQSTVVRLTKHLGALGAAQTGEAALP